MRFLILLILLVGAQQAKVKEERISRSIIDFDCQDSSIIETAEGR